MKLSNQAQITYQQILPDGTTKLLQENSNILEINLPKKSNPQITDYPRNYYLDFPQCLFNPKEEILTLNKIFALFMYIVFIQQFTIFC